MSKDTLNIETFNMGIMRNPDSKDIPANAASSSKNIESVFAEGKLKGIPKPLLADGDKQDAKTAKRAVWLKKSDDTETMVFHDGSAIKYIEDYYGSHNLADPGIAVSACTLVPSNRSVFVGSGDAVSELFYNDFTPWATLVTEGSGNSGVDEFEINGAITSYGGTKTIEIASVTDVEASGFNITVSDDDYFMFTYAGHGLAAGQTILLSYELFIYSGGFTGAVYMPVSAEMMVAKTVGDVVYLDAPYWYSRELTDGVAFDYIKAGSGSYKIDNQTTIKINGTSKLLESGQSYDLGQGLSVQFGTLLGWAAGDTWTVSIANANAESLAVSNVEYSNFASSEIIKITGNHNYPGEIFQKNTTYLYTHSLIYNGLHESPLAKKNVTPINIYTGASKGRIECRIKNYASLDKRVTGINIYRAEAAMHSTVPSEEFRLVGSYSINQGRWSNSGPDKVLTFFDYGNIGPTFEDSSGISEDLSDFSVTWGLACELNNELFVGQCMQQELPDAPYMIFKSLPFRYQQFNWTNDYLKLPDKPTAMASYNGRVYVFTKFNTYRINPTGLYIEDTFPNIGCSSKDSLIVTDYGLFWYDSNNAYGVIENQVTPVSYPIQYGTQSWHGLTYTDSWTLFDARRQSIIFAFALSSGTEVACWVVNIVKKRWDYYSFSGLSLIKGLFTGTKGDIYLVSNSGVYDILSKGAGMPWEWISGELGLNESSQLKYLYKLIIDATGSLKIEFMTNSTNWVTLTDDDIKVAGDYPQAKWIKFRITDSVGDKVANSVTLVFRRKAGKR
ncbi:MAG: hypothetical protein KKA84_12115 [Bacteroidetes bacterium]|nr:hypothetical protein [Bacteroidota bacterium]